jgi:hypothetical protein
MPEGARMRASCKRKLGAKWEKFRGELRFGLQCGLPVEGTMDQIDRLAEHILTFFPDAQPKITWN